MNTGTLVLLGIVGALALSTQRKAADCGCGCGGSGDCAHVTAEASPTMASPIMGAGTGMGALGGTVPGGTVSPSMWDAGGAVNAVAAPNSPTGVTWTIIGPPNTMIDGAQVVPSQSPSGVAL